MFGGPGDGPWVRSRGVSVFRLEVGGIERPKRLYGHVEGTAARGAHALAKIDQWATLEDEFDKRAAFALLASVALHRKELPEVLGSILGTLMMGRNRKAA